MKIREYRTFFFFALEIYSRRGTSLWNGSETKLMDLDLINLGN